MDMTSIRYGVFFMPHGEGYPREKTTLNAIYVWSFDWSIDDPLISILKEACLSLLDSLELFDPPNTPTFLNSGVDWRASAAPHLHDICVDSCCICLASVHFCCFTRAFVLFLLS